MRKWTPMCEKSRGLTGVRIAKRPWPLRGERDQVGCIILGRGERLTRRCRNGWVQQPPCQVIIAFAAGRTRFSGSLVQFRAKQIKCDSAISECPR